MTIKHLTAISTKATPQTEPIPGTVKNSAGGQSFATDDWLRLDRFLVLGCEGATYYASEQTITRENASAVERCIAADGLEAVRRIVAVSDQGRAPKNDPALFALAMAASLGNDATRKAALDALPKVARIGTHLFHFAQFVSQFRGWGRGLRKAIGGWYNAQDANALAYQAIKYQQRDGWSHRDLLRLSHPVPASDTHKAVYHWMTQGWETVGIAPHPDEALRKIWALEAAKRATTAKDVIHLIEECKLPREGVPTQFLNDMAIWDALLAEMPLTAMIRNLGKMSAIGLLKPLSQASKTVTERLGQEERIRKARVHPLAVLSAMRVYQQGHGERGSLKWDPVSQVVDALDAAFYLAFGNVEPTGKRWLLALDVSGSMEQGTIAGIPGLTPRDASAAMALITANVEPQHVIVGFTGDGFTRTRNALTPLAISPRQRLTDAIKVISNLPFGGTDCSLPMRYAAEKTLEVDAFVVYTDSETWAGPVHPVQALRQYRKVSGINAKAIVCGMVSNGFTIADPADGGMLDVVGFDTATPQIMADFVTR